MPVLVKLNGTSPKEFATGGFLNKNNDQELIDRWPELVKVPDVYTEGEAGEEKDAHCVAMVTEEFRELLANCKISDNFSSIELGLPLDTESLPADWFPKP
jgi:hypothetical protein